MKERIEEARELRSEPIAIVCFGPSLADTWEQIRDFKYVMTCSGSHKFLLERGIVPTWHVEVDPRPHKIDLLGEPHPGVTYLPASTVSPKYMDWLQKHNATVRMWHVFTSEAEAYQVLPRGEWAITGGSSVGLRCLTLARFFGFRDHHIFGMDGCIADRGSHAAAHPNAPPRYSLVEYKGTTYKTTVSILECAKQTWHELDVLKDVKATFHGEGLVQAMARDYVPKPAEGKPIIAINRPELISVDYARLNRQLHEENVAYGVGGGRHAPIVLKLADSLKTQSILDFGCGKGYLAKALPFPIWEYDPAVPGKDMPPRPADLVVCTDVLEHVEPDRILFVLDEIRRCMRKVGYFVIHTGPSSKSLADGRNTHLIQHGRKWWLQVLRKFFNVPDEGAKQFGPLLHVVCSPKSPKPIPLCKTPSPNASTPSPASRPSA